MSERGGLFSEFKDPERNEKGVVLHIFEKSLTSLDPAQADILIAEAKDRRARMVTDPDVDIMFRPKPVGKGKEEGKFLEDILEGK